MTASRQTRFRHAILDAAAPVPAGLVDGAGQPAGGRFSVYRNNVAVSLTEALEQTFPVIRKLIGEENFRALAGVYLRAHPPSSAILSRYGAGFADFLEGFEPLAHLGYLPDTARLEQAMVAAYHAADAPAFDASIFATTPPEHLGRITLGFAPAVQVLRSPWPIHGIWRFNSDPDAPQPPATTQDVLITRPEYDPFPRLLPAGGADFTTALTQGAALETAAAKAAETAPDFDLSALLSLFLQDNAIVTATLEADQ